MAENEIVVTYTPELVRRASDVSVYGWTKGKSQLWCLFFGLGFGLVEATNHPSAPWPAALRTGLLVTVISFVLMSLIGYFDRLRNFNLLAKHFPEGFGTWSFGEKEIRMSSVPMHAEIPWDMVKGLVRYPDAWVLMLGGMFPLPPDMPADVQAVILWQPKKRKIRVE